MIENILAVPYEEKCPYGVSRSEDDSGLEKYMDEMLQNLPQ